MYIDSPISYKPSRQYAINKLAIDTLQVNRYFTNYTVQNEHYLKTHNDVEKERSHKNQDSPETKGAQDNATGIK
jgi:hypothetical protein